MADEPAYTTLHGLIKFEVKHKLTKTETHGGFSGVKALERLLRAMEFVARMMQDLIAAPSDESAATVALAAYAATLSKHHGWIVRSTVQAAMYAVGSRGEVVELMCGAGSPEPAQHAIVSACGVLAKLVVDTRVPLRANDLMNL